MTKHLRMVALVMGVMALLSVVSGAGSDKKKKGSEGDAFYVFTERGSRLNHYAPSGWMGDFGDLKINQGWAKGVEKLAAKDDKSFNKGKDPASLKDETCIQVTYTAERKQGAGWAGIYWQNPANNWGDKKGGYNLTGYTKLTFWAKGEKGGEVVDKFYMGGITGQTEEGDSDEGSISPVKLTKDWQKYEISLTGLD